jgi:hypothetical protein
MNRNDTISRRSAAIDAAIKAKHAAAFYKAWSAVKVEMDDTCNKKEGLRDAQQDD